MLYKITLIKYFHLLGTKGFHVKAKNERFTAAGSRCGQNLTYKNFTSSFGRLRQKKKYTKKRAARAARLFFLIQPIISLICGDVVAVAEVPNRELQAWFPYDRNDRSTTIAAILASMWKHILCDLCDRCDCGSQRSQR